MKFLRRLFHRHEWTTTLVARSVRYDADLYLAGKTEVVVIQQCSNPDCSEEQAWRESMFQERHYISPELARGIMTEQIWPKN